MRPYSKTSQEKEQDEDEPEFEGILLYPIRGADHHISCERNTSHSIQSGAIFHGRNWSDHYELKPLKDAEVMLKTET